MTALWTAHAARAATGGRLEGGGWEVGGVSIDTRTIRPGDLFVALTAARDGHDFVAEAFDKGAAAALVTHRPHGVPEDRPLLIVDEVQRALEGLGRAGRARCGARVIAVTGSAGKTSTKELLRTVLTPQGATHASVASYNNHWGVPLTLARMPETTDFAVIEIGMNAPGEIAPLARMAQPHVAIVTTVAPAHLEAFDSVEGIAAEKASIFEGLEDGGVAIVNADLPTTPVLEAAARARNAHIVRFGRSDVADHRLISFRIRDDSTAVEARAGDVPLIYRVGAAGVHFALNALAVLAAVDAVGGDRARAMCKLAQWTPPGGRGSRETIVLDTVEDDMVVELIDDAFNANPASLEAALEVLAGMRPQDGVGRVAKGRRVAVLGDMLELGPTELDLHRAVADYPAMASIARVHCVGPRMRALWEVLPEEKRGRWTETAEDLAARAAALADAGDIVLVKGSKSSRVSLVVDAIRKLGHPRAQSDHEESA